MNQIPEWLKSSIASQVDRMKRKGVPGDLYLRVVNIQLGTAD